MTCRICLWSGPRNVSTALMYSFYQRPDTRVVDEPLYGHFLRVTGTKHPDRERIMAALPDEGNRVMERLAERPVDRPVLFAKQMAHHLVDVDLGWLEKVTNVFLLRDPRGMLPSLTKVIGPVKLENTGLQRQAELVEHLEGRGRPPICLDSEELLRDPAGVLRQLCDALGIPWMPTMLCWKRGPIPADGIWAPHWYGAVHASTGFRPWSRPPETVPDELAAVYEECRPYYDMLHARSLKAAVPAADGGHA